MTGLKDKNGFEIPNRSIIYGKHAGASHFFNIYKKGDLIEMIACTYGYIHDVKQEMIDDFLLIGSFEEEKHLLECD